MAMNDHEEMENEEYANEKEKRACRQSLVKVVGGLLLFGSAIVVGAAANSMIAEYDSKKVNDRELNDLETAKHWAKKKWRAADDFVHKEAHKAEDFARSTEHGMENAEELAKIKLKAVAHNVSGTVHKLLHHDQSKPKTPTNTDTSNTTVC